MMDYIVSHPRREGGSKTLIHLTLQKQEICSGSNELLAMDVEKDLAILVMRREERGIEKRGKAKGEQRREGRGKGKREERGGEGGREVRGGGEGEVRKKKSFNVSRVKKKNY